MLSSPSQNIDSFEIAPGVKITDWKELNITPESTKDVWAKAVEIFGKRIDRFLIPVKALMSSSDRKTCLYSGFAIMALDCLLIETLQSFRVGRLNPVSVNDKQSTKMIVDFLTQRPSFKAFFTDDTKAKRFCDHFRNGILHQGEVKSSGRIRIDTPQMIIPSDDNQSLLVNRWKFHEALVQEVETYKNELLDVNDDELHKNFIKKMIEICRIKI